MKTIVVVCENLTQFRDYVNKVYLSEIIENDRRNRITYEGVEFLWVWNHYCIRGRNFTMDSKLVKVGSWCNIPPCDLKEIEEHFEARKVK